MLSIIVNGQPLDLQPNTSINLELRSSLFNSEALEGSFSYSFSLPNSPQNKAVLGYLSREDYKGSITQSMPCTLVDGGIEIIGTLKVRSVKQESISVNVFALGSAVADKLKNLYLSDIDLGVGKVDTVWFGSILRANVVFTDGVGPTSEVFYWVPWQGSAAATIQELAATINRVSPGPPLHSLTQAYEQWDLVDDGAGNIYECTIANVGRPLVTPTYNSATQYYVGDQVEDSFVIYQCVQNSLGNPLTNTAYWVIAESYWLLLSSNWAADYENPITLRQYLYDDPDDTHRLVASVDADNRLVLTDIQNGVPDEIDWYLSFTNVFGPGTGPLWYLEPGPVVNLYEWYFPYTTPIRAHMARQAERLPSENPAYTFFPIFNPDFSQDSAYLDYVNYWYNDQFLTNPQDANNYHISAQPYLCHILKHVAKAVGLTATGSFFDDEENQRIVLYSNASNERTIRRLKDYDGHSIEFDLRQNVPKAKLGEFLNAIRSYLFVGVFFDLFRQKVELVDLEDVLASTEYDDWSDLVEPSPELSGEAPQGYTLSYSRDGGDKLIEERIVDPLVKRGITLGPEVADLSSFPARPVQNMICRVASLNQWYRANTHIVDNIWSWVFYSESLHGLTIGDGKTAYTPNVDVPLMFKGRDWARGVTGDPETFVLTKDYKAGTIVKSGSTFYRAKLDTVNNPLTNSTYWFVFPASASYQWLVPWAKQEKSVVSSGSDKPSGIRLLRYAGFQPDDAGGQYPLASHDVYRMDGTLTHTGAKSLRWDGPNGIYETRGKKWLHFLDHSKESVWKVRFTPGMLSKFSFAKKVRINGRYYLVKSVKLTLPLGGKLAEVTLRSL